MAKTDSVKTAETMAGALREISVAEFFEKNRHLLGFDNPAKALLTVVKEAVDNSIDACEEARILPDIVVIVKEPREVFRITDESGVEIGMITKVGDKLELRIGDETAKFIEKKEPRKTESVYIFEHGDNTYKFRVMKKEIKKENGTPAISEVYEFVRGRTELRISKQPADRFSIIVEDNGPGIVKEHIPRVFGKLIYGRKFMGGKQSRGQQGIGISASVLYSQLTAGKPAIIHSRTAANKPVYMYHLRIDTTKNEPIIVEEKSFKEPPPLDGQKPVMTEHGVRFEVEVEGKWIQRYHSVEEYIKQTAISNPYANITFVKPDGEICKFERVTKELPPLPKSIKPHPHGVEMGALERMLKLTDSRTLAGFLSNDFSRIGPGTAMQICKLSNLKPSLKPKDVDHEQLERLWRTLQSFAFMKPPMDCLSPMGEERMIEGLKKEYKLDFVTAVSRSPAVYRGMPFLIEVGVGYGGELKDNEPAKILRFANRVPLLYQAASCATTKAVQKIDWRHYGLDVSGNMPIGPAIIAIHMASVWIPYISEAKEAIAPYPVIVKEIKLALQDCMRKLQRYISGKRQREVAAQRASLFEKYIPEVAEAISKISDVPKEKLQTGLVNILKKGQIIFEDEKAEDENGTKPVQTALAKKSEE
ncbi:MAG: DNA topoisomerase VI subunit B [Candidatus Aenigmatarchaeota archaeon]